MARSAQGGSEPRKERSREGATVGRTRGRWSAAREGGNWPGEKAVGVATIEQGEGSIDVEMVVRGKPCKGQCCRLSYAAAVVTWSLAALGTRDQCSRGSSGH